MIELVPHDPAWAQRFGTEGARLRDAWGAQALRIDHVGSTSVPGLDAKPVIDVQLSVRTLEPHGWARPLLQALGYTHVDLGDFDRVYPYFHRPLDWPHTHHVHLCEAGGEQERRHLAFRDFLRRHADTAGEYLALKQRLARLHRGATREERERYSMAKGDFIEAVLLRAYAEGLPLYGASDA